MDIEMAIALISLATALIGLCATLMGKKEVIIIRENAQEAGAVQDTNATTGKVTDSGRVTESASSSSQAADESIQLSPEQVHWYDRTKWLVLWFILFYPVGIYGLVKSRTVKKSWKITICAGFAILILISALAEP